MLFIIFFDRNHQLTAKVAKYLCKDRKELKYYILLCEFCYNFEHFAVKKSSLSARELLLSKIYKSNAFRQSDLHPLL